MIFEKIDTPLDLKVLTNDELNILASEIRELLIKKISKVGGHLASNLGIVELSIALLYVFDSPKDKMIYDVSHQSYVHKMLTGRKKAFMDENHYDDVTGFFNPNEGEYDSFFIGHSSTSISLASGMAKARDVNNQKQNVIAIIGDAALDGGEALEALNYAKELNTGLIVVINDNDMSIPENYGAIKDILNDLYTNNGIADRNIFKDFGFEYYFVKDGNNIEQLIDVFKQVKDTKKLVVVHCRTIKGKGYEPAVADSEKFHWARPFDIGTGQFIKTVPKENYGSVIGEYILDRMMKDKKLYFVSPSMPFCVGFNSERRNKVKNQVIDVGIAEQNGISLSAGMVKNGLRVIYATNSSFYQRAYDQIEQEICLNKCPIIMLVSNTGVYGHFNNSHVGWFDITLFSNIPNLKFLAPSNLEEYISMLNWALEQNKFPVMIRIPWNGVYHTDSNVPTDYEKIEYRMDISGNDIALIGLGSFYQLAEQIVEVLNNKGYNPTLINPFSASEIDEGTLNKLKSNHKIIVTLEDGIVNGGFGAKISQYYGTTNIKVLNIGLPLEIPIKYIPNDFLEKYNLTADKISEKIIAELK